MSTWPSVESLLPARARLLTMVEQTVPARRLSFEDSVEHFEEAQTGDDRGWADMALLGVIGEAMQVLEDLAYVGEAYANPRLIGLPHYVQSIVFNPQVASTFYSRRRSSDDTSVLLSYRLRDPDTGEAVSPLDFMGASLSDRAERAWNIAAEATVAYVQRALAELSEDWRRFGRYHHAFKHGGLVVNHTDQRFVDDDGNVTAGDISVWARRTDEPTIAGNEEGIDRPTVVHGLRRTVALALDVLDLVIVTRLGMAEIAIRQRPQSEHGTVRISYPVRFHFGDGPVPPDEVMRDLDEIGITFSTSKIAAR